MCITALKIPKFFLNIFLQGRPYPTQHLAKPPGKGRAFYVKHRFSGLHGSWRWGCAEEWLGLKGPAQVRLACISL
jgi:hypothetical protein